MRSRVIVVSMYACALGGAACFASSSGGNGPDASFEAGSGELDAYGGDAATDVTVPDAEAGAMDSSALDSAHVLDSGAPADADAAPTLIDAAVFGDAGDAGCCAIRVANMASGLPSAVDFCIAPPGGEFAGPYMLGQGVASGIPYQAMSEYAALLPESSFTVRVVAAGATNCAVALVADVATGPSTDANPTTVVLAGSAAADAGAPLSLHAFVDDSAATSPPMNRTRFRIIHEAPGLGPATFQIGSSPYVIPVQTAVPYGATFAASTVTTGAVTPDAQGYVLPNMGSEQVELVLGGVETMSFYLTAAIHASATDSMTTFLVGTQGGAADPLGFVACDELATPAGHLAGCTFENGAPQTFPVRAVHVAPDQGAIDACVVVGTLPSTPNLLAKAGVSSGLSFLQMSGDLTSIPAGTDFAVAFSLVGQPCATQAFISTGSSVFYKELTVTLSESTLPPGTVYQQDILDTGAPASANAAMAAITNAAKYGGPAYDFYDTENGMSEVQIGSGGLAPNNVLSGLSFTPDTYAMRVAADATKTTVYTKSGIALAANQTYLFTWFPATTPSPGALALCPLGTRGASTLTSCSD